MTSTSIETTAGTESSFLARVFLWTGGGIAVSFFTAAFVAANQSLFDLVWGEGRVATVALLAPVVLIVCLGLAMGALPIPVAQTLYLTFTLLEGVALSIVFWVVPAGTLAAAFGAASVMFVGAGAVGLVAERDLGRAGMVGTATLIGVLFALLADVVWVDSVLPLVLVALFTLLTASEVWWLKKTSKLVTGADEAERLAVWGAIALFLDFVNLVLFLAYLLGSALGSSGSDG